MLHAYLPVGRTKTLNSAFDLLIYGTDQIFDISLDDVRHAGNLAEIFSNLTARDLLHLSVCQRRHITEIKTYDQGLQRAFAKI